MTRKSNLSLASCLAIAVLWTFTSSAAPTTRAADETRPVDLVIALDVSDSMSGLIESAKQRLWDIVNEIAQARPRPDLRIAILSYGNPAYGVQSGYVRVNHAFTRDLDSVMQTLFGFGTDGGEEYVARAVSTAVTELAWRNDATAMKVLFVAGNERADQDPTISVAAATKIANSQRIVVNTLYCGSDRDDIAAGWRGVATATNGLFASIDQNAAAVAGVGTPMDTEIARLNQALNETYVAYGANGIRAKHNQIEQDKNAADLGLPSVASRAAAKAGSLYRNESWDLVDANRAGIAVETLPPESLPEPLRAMQPEERRQFVDELATKREVISEEIARLAQQRQRYIEAERANRPASSPVGLDEAMRNGLRELASAQGFEIDAAP